MQGIKGTKKRRGGGRETTVVGFQPTIFSSKCPFLIVVFFVHVMPKEEVWPGVTQPKCSHGPLSPLCKLEPIWSAGSCVLACLNLIYVQKP